MSAQTCYVALPFDRSLDGSLAPKGQRQCVNADDALREAQALGSAHAGAIAMSRVIDIDTGRTAGARILSKIGDVPSLRYLLGR